MKSKLAAALCILALFIPTYIAIASHFTVQKAPVNVKSIEKVEISDLSQRTFVYTADTENCEMIDFFTELNSRAISVTSLPDQLMSSPFFKVVFTDTNSKEAVYKYYFSSSANESYFLDDKGYVYRIKTEDAESFLSLDCAAALYASSTPPSLFAGDSDPILPKGIVWNYKNAGGEFNLAQSPKTADSTPTFDMTGGIDIEFDTSPDFLNSKIYKGDELLYDGAFDELTELDISEQSSFKILLEAKWFKDDSRDYFGDATYEFFANISAPAAFYAGKTALKPGDFTLLTGVNIKDITKIKFTAEPAITYGEKTFTPVFYQDGKYVRALIPTTYESSAHEKYTITLEYGVTKQTITLDMKPRVYGNSVITPTLAVINATRTPEKLDAFAEAVSAVTATGDAQRYWDGNFIEAVTGGVVRSGYGRYRTITTTGELYRHTGMDYAINSGSDVRAINDGKVIYTGVLDYTGNIVIVEHGYGLKSWYYHLSKIDVAIGDTVSKGDVIAKSGNTGFTAFPVVYVGLSIFDFPVCQYDLWNEGIPVYIEEE